MSGNKNGVPSKSTSNVSKVASSKKRPNTETASSPSSTINGEGASSSNKKVALESLNSEVILNNFRNELQCPICFQYMEDPYVTICAHSFCYQCIKRSLEAKKKCPKCAKDLNIADQIFPNFALAGVSNRCRLLDSQRKQLQADVPSSSKWSQKDSMLHMLSDPTLDLQTVTHMIELLHSKKNNLEQTDKTIRNILLKEFLDEMINRRKHKVSKLSSELQLLEADLKHVQAVSFPFSTGDAPVVPSPTHAANGYFDIDSSIGSHKSLLDDSTMSSSSTSPTNTAQTSSTFGGSNLLNRRLRLRTHFDDLEQQYLLHRTRKLTESEDSSTPLNNFVDNLTKMTQFSNFRLLGTLNYNVDMYSGLSIVSSIEFDRDGELFTIAGVTKKIKLYDYNAVLQSAVDVHCPVREMQCNSKISCVSWNPYNKSLLASSDYEGIVQLWDVYSGVSVKKFQEHEKRCWSVCFNFLDPNVMASGSDDAKDHCVHYYDLRNTKQALLVFRGHKKAVSYVKFTSPTEIVSASTDSQLRLWSVNSGQCVRVFKGHQNEKNFVGLDTENDFIACGSENNLLYIYYKELSKPLMTHAFGVETSILDRGRVDPDSNDFVSAVCWKKKSNVVLAANSLGTIKILELN